MQSSTASNPESLAPSQKRRRQEPSDHVPIADLDFRTVKRSSCFWFEDGSVILQVEGTQFRVHRGVLCANSGFFKDLFGVPQPENEPLVEGCPVVCVHDAKEDWVHLLMYIYHSTKLEHEKTLPTFEFIASLLRLGKKYQFDHLRDNSLNRLTADLVPGDLSSKSAWLARWAKKRKTIIDCVNLASELDIKTLLPSLYYLSCTEYSTSQILRGVCDPDTKKVSRFTPATLELLLVAREKIRPAITRHTLGWVFDAKVVPRSKDCTAPNKCQRARTGLLAACGKQLGTQDCAGVDLMNYWTLVGFCDACNVVVGAACEAGRKGFWREMPGLFDMPPWENLKDFQS